MDELNNAQVVNSTSFTYDPNGNPLSTAHDDAFAEYAYDVRDLVERVTNADTPGDTDAKVTTYSYTARGQRAGEDKPNGNTVAYDYYLDGLLKHQRETKSDGTTVVSEHAVSWDANGNRTTDVSTTMDADDPGAHLDRTHTYSYDPRDRIAEVVKTDTSSGSTLATESYVHDAASNVIEQTVDGSTTTFNYDRNRLLTATTGGVTGSYNYDPFGRLDTVVSAGQVVESYSYDGFDRIAEHTSIDETGASESTSYSYDAMDRTTSRTDTTGETTDFSYLGLSGEVLNEEIAGEVQKSYQYSPWGQRLSQIKHNTDGTSEDGYYGYNPHTDVETLTDDTGNTTSTYGYTAYGKDDEAEFTGVDAPDAGTPGEEPYNVYRYNSKRFDAATGTYDMGFRDYSPAINRFLSRDMYTGALADLNLTLSPWTMNRYAFAGGNPTTLIELDGHVITEFDEVPTTCGDLWNPCPAYSAPPPAEITEEPDENNWSNIWDSGNDAWADVLIWHDMRGLDPDGSGVVTHADAYFADWLTNYINDPNRPFNNIELPEETTFLGMFEHEYADVTYCAVLCGGVTLQEGHVQLKFGGFGGGGWATAGGVTTAPPNEQGMWQTTACGAFYVGACGNAGNGADGSGPWVGGSAGVARGLGGQAGAMVTTVDVSRNNIRVFGWEIWSR